MASLAFAILAHLAFAVTTVVLVIVDLREHRLPNRVVGWGSLAVLVLLTLAAGSIGQWQRLMIAALAALVYGAVFFLLWLVAPAGIGPGDVKLAPLIGGVAGWAGTWIAALWVPTVLALLILIAFVIARKRKRPDFAFGPIMLTACWVGVVLAGVEWIR